MRVHKLAVLTATMAFGAVPALALASGSGEHSTGPPATTPASTHSNKPATPGPKAGLPAKAKAYGRYCQGQSKKHVAGTPGTPFSKCVTDMAKLANGSVKSPRTACKDEPKKHVAGTSGTPFSRCVSGGAKLLKDKASS